MYMLWDREGVYQYMYMLWDPTTTFIQELVKDASPHWLLPLMDM